MRYLSIAAAAAALAACGKGSPAVFIPANEVPPCEARFFGQVLAEAAAVDATPTHVYWLDYNFGTLQRQPRGGGETETLAKWPEEHLAESMRVANGYVYWPSKATQSLYRLPEAGGTPEVLLTADGPLLDVEVVGDIVYVSDFDGHIRWWRSPGEHGTLDLEGGELAIAAAPDALLVGGHTGIDRIASPGAGAQRVLETSATVDQLAVGPAATYWLQGEELFRAAGAQVENIAHLHAYSMLAAAPGGLYVGQSNVVYFVADDTTELVPVAIVPAAITDLELRGASLFVGTAYGSVHEVCGDPAAPVTLDPPAPCEGNCTWYDSGAVEMRISQDLVETFYADGSSADDGALWSGN